MRLEESGPQIIQAGQRNYTSTSVKIGFLAHLGAWPDGVLLNASIGTVAVTCGQFSVVPARGDVC
jgi:hypothetical protein